MLVKELIEKLQQMNPDDLVVLPGYEDGWDDVNCVKVVVIREHYVGSRYELGKYEDCDEESVDVMKCVALR